MHNKNNNKNKDKAIELSPERIEKCFFAIENEFQEFECRFIIHQLKKRTNLNLNSGFPLRPLGIDFIMWFLDRVQSDMGIFGSALAEGIIFKLKRLKNKDKDYFFSRVGGLSKSNLTC